MLAGSAMLGLLAGCGGGGIASESATPLGVDTRAAEVTVARAQAISASAAGEGGVRVTGATVTAADTTWTPCATENQTCAFTGTRQVRYGTDNAFVVLTLTNGTACTNEVFGDPAYGVVKSCSVAPAAETTPGLDPSQWTVCASEGGHCTFDGTRNVRYGTIAQATVQAATGGTDCTNAVFGDPVYGQAKTCWVSPAPAAAAWTDCAVEGQHCDFNGVRTVRYGAGTAFATGVYTNGVDCSNAIFGDPAYGLVKTCSVAVAAADPAVPTPTPPVPTPPAPTPPTAPTVTIASVVLPALTRSAMGTVQPIVAQAFDANGSPIPGASYAWSVANTDIATIDANGQVTPVRAGYTSITATAGGKTATGVLTVRGPVPLPTRSDYVGTNLSGPSYYSPNMAFSDLMKNGTGWSAHNQDGSTGSFPGVGPDGAPTSLAPGQHAWATVTWAGTHKPSGQYVVVWEGDGSLSFPLSNVRIVSSAPHRIVLELVDIDTQITVSIDSTSAANPIRNLHVLLPGTEATYATQPFNPEFLTKTAPFSTLRFMDWGNTNGSSLVEWANRSHLGDATYAGPVGVPIEAMIQLANTLHADPWICIPHMASDDYVAQFAKLLHDTLDPTLHPHIEYSNEMWNTGFSQTQWAIQRSDALGLDRPWGTPSLFYAKRAVEMFNIMRQVYGAADAPRLVRVLAGQAAWTQFLDNGLAYGSTATSVDAIAVAPYFTAPDADNTANAATTMTLNASQIADQWLTNIRGDIKSWMNANGALAARYRLKLKAYESGPGDSAFYFPSEQQGPIVSVFAAANGGSRMRDLYAEYYSQWKAAGGDTMLQYYDVGGWGIYGFWGALQYVYQDPATSPKYQGLLSFIGANPRTASEALGPVTP